jgi:hypothetical protein
MQEIPPAVPAIIRWLNDSSIGTGIRESIWTFPLVEATHVLALGLSVGVLVWFDLRLMGLTMRHQAITHVHRQVMPYAIVGFIIMFISGGLVFWSEAVKCYVSIFFRIKVLMLFLAGLNALIFEMTTKKTIVEWDKAPVPPLKARLAGVFSLILWIGVISAGRATAYNLF